MPCLTLEKIYTRIIKGQDWLNSHRNEIPLTKRFTSTCMFVSPRDLFQRHQCSRQLLFHSTIRSIRNLAAGNEKIRKEPDLDHVLEQVSCALVLLSIVLGWQCRGFYGHSNEVRRVQKNSGWRHSSSIFQQPCGHCTLRKMRQSSLAAVLWLHFLDPHDLCRHSVLVAGATDWESSSPSHGDQRQVSIVEVKLFCLSCLNII